MEQFYLVLTQLEMFAVMVLLGIWGVKAGVLSEISLGDLSKLIMRLILPVMIFHKSVNGSTRNDIITSFGNVIFATVLTYFLLYGVGALIKSIFGLKGNYGRVFHASAMFGNVGFIGIPLILGLLPEHGMLYMAIFTILDQAALWTIGYQLTMPEEKRLRGSLMANLRNMLNPAMISIFLAIAFILFDWKIPVTINKALGAIGDATTPLSLIYIGGTFCFCNVLRFLTKIEYYAIVLAKMICVPLLVFIGLRYLGFQSDLNLFITTLSGMPSMAAIAMFARVNGSDDRCAVGAIMVTTVCCLFTLPLVAYLTAIL
jgi:malate permease and related proteins